MNKYPLLSGMYGNTIAGTPRHLKLRHYPTAGQSTECLTSLGEQ